MAIDLVSSKPLVESPQGNWLELQHALSGKVKKDSSFWTIGKMLACMALFKAKSTWDLLERCLPIDEIA